MVPNYFDFTLELTLNPSLFFVISGVSTTVVAVDDPKAYWAPKTRFVEGLPLCNKGVADLPATFVHTYDFGAVGAKSKGDERLSAAEETTTVATRYINCKGLKVH